MNINSKCICGQLNYKKDIICFLPCKHLMHKECYFKNNNQRCFICNEKIEKIINKKIFKEKLNDPIYKQIYINILSKTCNKRQVNYIILLSRFIEIVILLISSFFVKNINDIKKWSIRLFKLCNLKIKIENKEKDIQIKKIYTSNHSSHMDFLILLSIGKMRFLHNGLINKLIDKLGLSLKKVIYKNYMIDTNSSNIVNKIKNFVEKNDYIVIFPEGQRTHTKTLGKFATGAFANNIPIQPIILKFNKEVYFESQKDSLLSFLGSNDIEVTIKYLDIIYPPFNKEKIEDVRKIMAIEGNLHLSNVYYKL